MASREPATAYALPTSSGTVGGGLPKQCRIAGWSANETGAAASVTVRLLDGGASGTLVGTFTCQKGASDHAAFAHEIIVQNGLYAAVSGTGVLDGVVYIG